MNFIHGKLVMLLFSMITIIVLNSCSEKRRVFLDEFMIEDYYKSNENLMYAKNFKVYKMKLYNTIKATIKDI